MLSLRRSEDAASGHMTQKIRIELVVASTERFDWKERARQQLVHPLIGSWSR
jgi:hypothetical protein